MEKDEILAMYKSGYSIDFIANQYFRIVNKDVKKNFYADGSFFVQKQNITKQKAYDHVCKVILDDCLRN